MKRRFRSPRRVPGATFLALSLAVFGCTTSGTQGSVRGSSVQNNGRTPCFIVLENHGVSDLRVYALRGETSRIPLGRVGSLQERRVRLPQALLGTRYINLLAVPTAAGESYVSERVYLEEGTEVVWRLKNDLHFSTIMVRSGG